MEDNKNVPTPIDLTKICKKLWAHKKTYFKVLPIVLVGTYLLTLCVPRYYSCEVSLAPEASGTSAAGGSLSSLASSFGLGGLAKMGNNDAIYSEIYPNLFKSNDFIVKLMAVEVTNKTGDIKCDYYTYIKSKQKSSPWDALRGMIAELLDPTPKDNIKGVENLDIFNLTKPQSEVFDAVKGKIKCTVDKKTDVITLTIQDQDPLIAATIAKEACEKLQEFIIAYRTHKASIDYEYYKKLCVEAKADYEKSRGKYSSYSDANMNVVLESYKSKGEGLRGEMQMRQELYTTLTTQMQMARAKLQEATPAFTVLQSASVPVKPAGPKRTLIAIGITFFAAIITSLAIIRRKSTNK